MRKILPHRLLVGVIGVLLAAIVAACSAPQQGGASGGGDGNGKVPGTVHLVVPFETGGGTDIWARVVAPYYQKALGGKVIVDNVPGGESIPGTNQFVQSGGTDGGKLLVTSGSTYIPALLNRKEVKYDFTKLIPLVVNGTGGAVYVSSKTGIKKAGDLKGYGKTLVYGGISATGNDLVTLLAMNVLGVKMKATFGFEGRGPARLALERGEINLDYQTTSAYVSEVEPMIKDGKATPLFSFGVLKDGKIVRDPALPKLPTLEEVYQQIHGKAPSGTAYDAYRAFLAAGYFYQKGIWANEGTSDSLVTSFRDAANQMAKGEDFKAKSKEALGGYPLISGDAVGDDLTKTFDVSDDVRQYTLDLLKSQYDVTVETK